MKTNFATSSQGEINTLVKRRTTTKGKKKEKPPKVLWGKGVDTSNTDGLLKRAQRKTIGNKLILSLVDIAKAKEDYKQAQAYWNTFHCQRKLIKSGGRLYGEYCKNRFCAICSDIRKADIINRYLPIMKQWKQPYFVTLTARAVKYPALKERINRMLKSWRKILDTYIKRNERGTGIALVGIKSLECNFNPISLTYNPHFHLIVETEEMADILIAEWLKRCRTTHAGSWAQKKVAVYNTETALIEIIKYGTKIFTDPTMDKKNGKNGTHIIYARAYHNIIKGFSKHRLFDRFGFDVPKREKLILRKETNDYNELIFSNQMCDWVNPELQDFLTGYQPTNELADMLENNIDTELQ